MNQTIEVIYEDNVLKPVNPIKGLKEKERISIILCPNTTSRSGLRELAGTLTMEEAEEMQRVIDKEFEKIEGEW